MKCKNCGMEITLVPQGQHFKWVTNPAIAASWRCGDDPHFPTLSHQPEEQS